MRVSKLKARTHDMHNIKSGSRHAHGKSGENPKCSAAEAGTKQKAPQKEFLHTINCIYQGSLGNELYAVIIRVKLREMPSVRETSIVD